MGTIKNKVQLQAGKQLSAVRSERLQQPADIACMLQNLVCSLWQAEQLTCLPADVAWQLSHTTAAVHRLRWLQTLGMLSISSSQPM